MPSIKETELYLPIKRHLEELGFSVNSEVRDCDLTALKDEHLVIVELKTSFNLELVLQGVERKRICDDVFLAVPRLRNMRTLRWRRILRMCKALGLGILTVSPTGKVEALCQPLIQPPRKSAGPKRLLLGEIAGRSGDYNVGGSKGRPLVTAYREQALIIAKHIGSGQQRPRDLVVITGNANAPAILQKNYYGWFQRVDRGLYQLSASGHEALILYADVLKP